MHFNDLAATRQSCRNFDPARGVTDSVLTEVCAESLLSPSACNSQPWKIVLVHSPAAKEACVPAFHAPFIKDAPAIAVLCETPATLKPFVIERLGDSQYFAQIDMGILAAHMTLAAAEHGLGSCIIGMFDEKILRSALELAQDVRPRLAVALGYAAPGDPLRKKIRKPIEETLTIF